MSERGCRKQDDFNHFLSHFFNENRLILALFSLKFLKKSGPFKLDIHIIEKIYASVSKINQNLNGQIISVSEIQGQSWFPWWSDQNYQNDAIFNNNVVSSIQEHSYNNVCRCIPWWILSMLYDLETIWRSFDVLSRSFKNRCFLVWFFFIQIFIWPWKYNLWPWNILRSLKTL